MLFRHGSLCTILHCIIGEFMVVSPFLILLSFAHAQEPDLGHFLAPANPLASVDGASSHWLNPANLGFDSDSSSLSILERHKGLADWTAAMAGGEDNLSFGLLHRRYESGDRWWSAGLSQAIPLGDSFRLGAQSQWNWGGERAGFLTMDFGMSYRPASWFGLGAVARNAVGRTSETPLSYNAGLVFRPLGDRLYFGADYGIDGAAETAWAGTTTASIAIRPVKALQLRGQFDDNAQWGVGIELHGNGSGFGVFSAGMGDTMTYTLSEGLPGHGNADAQQKNEAPLFKLGKSYAYEPMEGFFGDKDLSYLELLQQIRIAAEDPEVQVIALSTEGLRFSFAQLQEIRSVLMDAKSNGKELAAYMGEWSQLRDYYIASVCDRIALHPGGNLVFTGIGVERRYFAGTLALAGISPEFSKQGDYKSAVEVYTRTGASEKATEQTEALLDDLWTSLISGIAHARGLSEEAVSEAVDRGPMTASQALEGGWVDELTFRSEFKSVVQHLNKDVNKLKQPSADQPGPHSGWEQPDNVAVVTIAGPIVPGKSARQSFLGGGNAGAETVAAALRRAKKRKDIKAVVLRVDSPGGSASASEDIWKAVTEIQEAGKPVVVSMGGVAASGGYYVAASADAILAEPTTITGSIGAYAGRFTFKKLYEKIGISTEFSGRGRMANMFSSAKPMDPVEWERFDALAQDVYRRFVEKVAEGRDMSVEEVEAVASGRVWSGEDALEHGLVDQLGGFEEAIALAAQKADLEEGFQVVSVGIDLKEDIKAEIMKNLGVNDPLTTHLPAPLADLVRYEWILDEHLFMMLPYQLTVH
jgi:protease-4